MLAPPAPWFAPYDGLCEGADWQRNHQAAGVDVATFQLWPDDWLLAPEPWKLQWSRRWVRLADARFCRTSADRPGRGHNRVKVALAMLLNDVRYKHYS